MKRLLLSLFSLCLIFTLPAQDIKSEIERLKNAVESQDYRSALQIADQLIGEGVKEDLKEYAADVYLYRGIAKHDLSIDEDAIIDLKVAHTLNPELKEAYFYIAEIYYDLTSYSSALENVIYFLEGRPEDIGGLALKSKSLLKLGEHMAAKITIQKAISIRSSEPELYYIRAAVNNALGRVDLACKDATTAQMFGYGDADEFVESFCNQNEE